MKMNEIDIGYVEDYAIRNAEDVHPSARTAVVEIDQVLKLLDFIEIELGHSLVSTSAHWTDIPKTLNFVREMIAKQLLDDLGDDYTNISNYIRGEKHGKKKNLEKD